MPPCIKPCGCVKESLNGISMTMLPGPISAISKPRVLESACREKLISTLFLKSLLIGINEVISFSSCYIGLSGGCYLPNGRLLALLQKLSCNNQLLNLCCALEYSEKPNVSIETLNSVLRHITSTSVYLDSSVCNTAYHFCRKHFRESGFHPDHASWLHQESCT
jgi:hypothetical protein